VNGSLDPDSGCPIIEIEVSGPFGKPQKFSAMMDTGFSGFLSLPILKAFPLGLILQGTMGITLADGSTHARLTARGAVTFDTKMEVGLILLEWQNTDILIGMDFLVKFGKQLTVCAVNKRVEIVDSIPVTAPAPILTMSPPATDIKPGSEAHNAAAAPTLEPPSTTASEKPPAA
jgi:predicted aspartyl protease